MTIQVSYPGVYIEETEPAAPIAGVSTSVAAFIGLAAQGPIGTPTFVSDLDDFTAKFGGSVVGAAPYYLPIAVEGFFRNGGTLAYIVRMGTGRPAFAEIAAASNAATKLATAEALLEGSAGDGGAIQVTHSSALGTVLTTAGLAGALDATPSTPISNVDATKLILTVGSTEGFEPGDDVAISKTAGGTPLSRTIDSIDKTAKTITLTSAVTAAAVNGIGIDIASDQSRLRLAMPAGVSQSLSSLIPPGSVVSVVDDDASPAWGVVAQSDSAGLVLTQPLGKAFPVAKNPKLETLEFTIAITDAQNVARTYDGLSTTPSHPRWWATAVTDPYARIRLEKDANGAYVTITGADPRPAAGAVAPLAPAVPDNAAQSWLDVQNPAKVQAELDKLEPIDEISLVAIPGVVSPPVQQVVLTHCEQMADRFAVFDAPRVPDPPAILAHRLQLIGDDKGFAALYYPWITIFDPARNQVVPQPPSGHVVGIIARTDERRGVHKAPANAVIRGAIGVEVPVSDNQQKLLNPNGVNAIRILPGRAQPLVWGARTTAKNTNWQYVNIRRLFLFLEESIQESLMGSVFEPNDLALWQKLKRTITEFLTRVWQDGALFGATAKEAFFVRIDGALNPPATRKLGRLYIEIGVQPVYPAEFIIVRIGIWDGGAEVAEL